MNERETEESGKFNAEYERRFQKSSITDRNAVFFLGDNTRFSYTWTCTSNALPTFRRQGGKFWIPSLNRWMVGAEKLAALGYPVTEDIASTMGLRHPLPVADPSRTDSVCGNVFHFTNCGVVLLLALTCFGPVADDTDPSPSPQ